MNKCKHGIGPAFVLVAGMLLCGVAGATPVTMDFDGLTPGTSVHTYYDGGCSVLAIVPWDCDGQDYGVVWENAYTGWLPGTFGYAMPGLFPLGEMTMNVAGGFGTGLSFDYGGITGSVSVFSGLDGQGTLLASSQLGSGGTGFIDLGFSGTAKSAVFSGLPVLSGFDNVTFQAASVPEPAAPGVFGLGLLLVGAFVGLRRRTGAASD